MTLPLDYRPEIFEEIDGNASTVRAITTILKRDVEERPHAFLLTGPSGCGKTTLARIIVKELGCHGSDFYELDSAGFRGIDTIRDIRKHMKYTPAESKCRVWFLDECHKLTGDAQEALLKALEDTPKHVYFILATTEPEKLKVTLRRRCSTFEIKPLSSNEMMSFLLEIVEAEEKKVPKDVLKTIGQDSLGSPGVALMILDKIIDLPADEMEEAAKQVAETTNQVIELCRAVFNQEKWPVVAKILNGLEKEDPEQIRRAALGYCSSVLLRGDQKSNHARAYLVLDSFREPFYNTGRPGLVLACFEVLTN